MRSLETTSADLETTSQFGTWKRMQESFQRLEQLLEVAATVGSYGNCWKLRRLLESATGCRRGPQYDGKCSFYFNSYFFRTTPTNRDLRQKAVYFPPRHEFISYRLAILNGSWNLLSSGTNTLLW